MLLGFLFLYHMLSRRLLVACVALLSLFAWLYFGEGKREFVIPMGVVFTIGLMIWIFQFQINWFWYKRRPPGLPVPMHDMYMRSQPFYAEMAPEDQKKFGERTSLYVQAKDWIAKGPDNTPEDLKYIIAFYAVALTFNKEDYLMKGFDRIVFYLHPFLTPHYKDQVHTYEVEQGDGTMIFAVNELTTGFMTPGKYYQTGLHALAEVFAAKFEADYPGEDIWPSLEAISGVSKSKIEDLTGLNQDDPWPVAVHHWFSFRSRFMQTDLALYNTVGRILGAGEAEV